MRVGVAISTTGDEHRLPLLAQSVENWDRCLPDGASLFVTVDGSLADVARVEDAVSEWTRSILRVGRPRFSGDTGNDHRLGVAANKNTGLEALMDNARCNWMFLSDDDSWPRDAKSLSTHVHLGIPHSMVCWGRHRRAVTPPMTGYTSWTWPRGSVLYVERHVVEAVGGMIEEFGTGGHEHVEWSRRIHEAGFTPCWYPSPASYAEYNFLGAARLWHCEDMPLRGEPIGNLRQRRRELSSMRRRPEDEKYANQIMERMQGSKAFIPFRAAPNGRLSATMSHT